MKVIIENIGRSQILFGIYSTGAALGSVAGPQVTDLSPTWCALVSGVLILFLLPLTLVEKFLGWRLAGKIGILSLVVLIYMLLSSGGGITSLFIIALPLFLITFVASARG